MQVETILNERQNTHGDFSHNAFMTQNIKDLMRGGSSWWRMTQDQRESIEMIALKMGRILTGNPDHKDHWDDIAGYATLVARRLEQ